MTLPDRRFSALQRAENSSIVTGATHTPVAKRFSALQRAENSSIYRAHHILPVH